MLMAIDVGNTNMVFGLLDGERTWNKPNYNVNLSAQCPISKTSLLAFDGSFDSAYSGM